MANSISDNRRNNGAKPKSKADRLLGLRDYLARPDNRARKITYGELAKHFNKSAQWVKRNIGEAEIAQEWLTANQDAPLDLKVHYQGLLSKNLDVIDAKDVEVIAGDKTYFVSRETAKETTKRISSQIKNVGHAAVNTLTIDQETKQVSKDDMVINRIREAYVNAPVGDMPGIHKIMVEFGLLSPTGVPTSSVTEEMVRSRMIEEDWKSQRSDALYKTLDIIPDEIRLTAMVRNVEMQKILFNEAKSIHRNNTQYYLNGKVVAGADRSKEIEWKPDAGGIATIAEVLRRMTDGGGTVNILNVNQFGGEGSSSKGQSNISPVTRTYLARIQKMDVEDMIKEISQFDQLIGTISTPPPPLSRDEVDDQEK